MPQFWTTYWVKMVHRCHFKIAHKLIIRRCPHSHNIIRIFKYHQNIYLIYVNSYQKVWKGYFKSRDVISVFSRGGHNFDWLPRGGGKIWKKTILRAKTQKITIFKIRGGKCPPPCAPYQMTYLFKTDHKTNWPCPKMTHQLKHNIFND